MFLFNREQMRMVLALTVVAIVTVFVLGFADMITREPIAEAKKAALHKALTEVLPDHANDPLSDAFDIEIDGTVERFFPARDKAGAINALAWETVAPDGYSGTIRILMSVLPDGTVNAIRITDHRETPGLGDGIVKNNHWLGSFAGRSLDNARWAVKKDGGDFDQFTGATITPRAVIKAVAKGLEMFRANRDRLLNPAKAGNKKEIDHE